MSLIARNGDKEMWICFRGTCCASDKRQFFFHRGQIARPADDRDGAAPEIDGNRGKFFSAVAGNQDEVDIVVLGLVDE